MGHPPVLEQFAGDQQVEAAAHHADDHVHFVAQLLVGVNFHLHPARRPALHLLGKFQGRQVPGIFFIRYVAEAEHVFRPPVFLGPLASRQQEQESQHEQALGPTKMKGE